MVRTPADLRFFARSPHRALVVTAVFALVHSAHAQSAHAPNLHKDDLLAGPRVSADALHGTPHRPSIVHRTFEGTLERAGAEPGRTALEAMREAGGEWELNSTEHAALDATITARAVAFDALLRENYSTIVSLASIGQRASSTSTLTRVAALADLALAFNRFDSYFDRGSFIDEFARVEGVRSERVTQARELEKRYIDSLVRDGMQSSPAGTREFAIRVRLRLEHFGVLLREAVEAKVRFGKQSFDDFADQLDLDALQREKVQAILAPLYLAQWAKNATATMRREAYSEIYALCSLEQRRALLEFIAANKVRAADADSQN